ncbi:MAG: hypothetical protein WDZ96_01445 [Acidimicrobiia bacterium]
MRFILLKGDRGAGLVEYALIVMLISVLSLTAVGFVGEETSDSFEAIGSSFDTDAELSPEEKWDKAKADYDDAIADAKAKRADDKAKAKAEYQAAVAENKDLPKAERNKANKEAKAKHKSANSAANADYKSSVGSAKKARNEAKAEYNATK